MAITQVGSVTSPASAPASGAATFTATMPTGIQAGDIVFCLVSHRSTVGWQTPSGWTKIIDQSSGNITTTVASSIASLEIFYFIHSGSLPTLSFSKESGTSDASLVRTVAYRSSVGRIGIASSAQGTAASAAATVDTSSSVTGSTNDYLLIVVGGADNVGTTSYQINSPVESVAELTSGDATTANGSDCSIGIAGKVLTSNLNSTVRGTHSASARHAIGALVITEPNYGVGGSTDNALQALGGTDAYSHMRSTNPYSGDFSISGSFFVSTQIGGAGGVMPWHGPQISFASSTVTDGYRVQFLMAPSSGIQLMRSGTEVDSSFAVTINTLTNYYFEITHNSTTGNIVIKFGASPGSLTTYVNYTDSSPLGTTSKYSYIINDSCTVFWDDFVGTFTDNFDTTAAANGISTTAAYSVASGTFNVTQQSDAAITLDNCTVTGTGAILDPISGLLGTPADNYIDFNTTSNTKLMSTSTYSGGTVTINASIYFHTAGTNVWNCPNIVWGSDANDWASATRGYMVQIMADGMQLLNHNGGTIYDDYWVPMSMQTWHTFVVTHNTSTGAISVSMDGTERMTATDTHSTSGYIGFINDACRAWYDDISGTFTQSFDWISTGSKANDSTIDNFVIHGMSSGTATVTQLTAAVPITLDSVTSSSAVSVGSTNASISTLVDNFNDNAINNSLWYRLGTTANVNEVNGRLEVTLAAGNNDYYSYESQNWYSLLESSIFVRVHPVPVETAAQTSFYLYVGTSPKRIQFTIDGANLKLQYNAGSGNVQIGSDITYNLVTHAWLRFREASGTIYWETAPSTASNPPASNEWTSRGSVATSTFGTADTCRVALETGSWQALTTGGTAWYDGVNTASNTLMPLAETVTDNFSTNTIGDLWGHNGEDSHNYFLQSETFDNASWIKVNTTITADVGLGPEGGTTADRVLETTTSGEHRVRQSLTPANGLTFNEKWTFRARIAPISGGRTRCKLRVEDISYTGRIELDIQNMTTTPTLSTLTDGTSFTIYDYGYEAIANGFTDYWITFSLSNTSATSLSSMIALTNDSGTQIYAGDITKGFDLGGFQLTKTPGRVAYSATTTTRTTSHGRWASITNGRLEVSVPVSNNGFTGVWTNGMQIEGSSVFARITPLDISTPTDSNETCFEVWDADTWSHGFRVVVGYGTCIWQKRIGGTTTDVAYGSNWTEQDYSWYRIRRARGVWYGDVAPGWASNPPIESDWINMCTVQTPRYFEHAAVIFNVGSWQATTNPANNVAIIDGFNTAANSDLLVQKVENLIDNFDDNSTNLSLWTTAATGFGNAAVANITISEANGKLSVSYPANNNPNYGGYTSINEWCLTGSSIFINVTKPNSNHWAMSTEFYVGQNGNLAAFIIEAGSLLCRNYIDGTHTNHVTLSYDGVAHKWLRIRESAGTVYWDTAPSTASNPPASNEWVNRYSMDVPWQTNHVKVWFGSGHWDTGADADTAYFDGVNTSANVATTNPKRRIMISL